jgi:cation:H+ antiporter
VWVDTILLLPVSFAILLAGALLFTNAIEWLGTMLSLGQGAVGSLLAAVATALPETLIPITAVVKSGPGADEVAIGAILGAPFMLATLAMALVGLSAYLWRRRRPQGVRLDVHAPTLERDLVFFGGCFGFAFLLGVLEMPLWVRVAAAVGLLVAYSGYVRSTLRDSGEVEAESDLQPLLMNRASQGPPTRGLVVLQAAVALGAIIGGANLFVEEIIQISEAVHLEPLVLSLVIAPFATELPEKANSVFWVRDGKDTLALGNITGAMVFQSTIPVAFGLVFTDWDLAGASMVACVLALAGGLLTYVELKVRNRFIAPAVVAWALLFAAFVGYVVIVT